jgi:hypothetical protein
MNEYRAEIQRDFFLLTHFLLEFVRLYLFETLITGRIEEILKSSTLIDSYQSLRIRT